MEKKRNQIAKGQSNFDGNIKHASTKQYARHRAHQSDGTKPQPNKNRNNSNNNNFHYDKRPQARKNGFDQIDNASGEASGLGDPTELNSVFNQGSKKQNLNHLLNFHYVQTEVSRASAFTKHGYHHKAYSKKYNKEQFLQANCQFVVKADVNYDYRKFSITPDALVEWDRIEKVLISSSEESQCPICLYPPVCGRMTRCGHIFCFSCMLHYLSLSDKTWRKCPICYESVHLGDLKSANSKQNHHPYKVGEVITLELMKREKGSLQVSKASEARKLQDFPNFSDEEGSLLHSKIIMANHQEVLKIIEREMLELEFQSIEDGDACPENIFVQQAMVILKQKQKELESNASQVPEVVEGIEVCEEASKERHESISDDGSKSTKSDVDAADGLKRFYFYQAPKAQNIFLHSLNSRMLQQMHESLENAPHSIQGKIVQIQCFTMDDDLRKRFKYLQHLPISSVFEIVEIDFGRGLISHDVMDSFKEEIRQRAKKRLRRDREEKKRETAINELNDKQMGKMLRSVANINIDSPLQFPECGTSLDQASPSTSTGPSFSKMLTSSQARQTEALWPSLAAETPSTSSFFGDLPIRPEHKKAPPAVVLSDEDDNSFDGEEECKVPVYKNQLGDCLANALEKSASMKGGKKADKKKKSKKMLLFASGIPSLK